VRFYRVSDIGSDLYLTLAKLRLTPKWLHLPKNTARKETTLHYKIRLANGESIRWLYKQIIQQKLQEIPDSSNTVSEWRNIKTINSQAADERFGKYKSLTKKKIKSIVQKKSLAYRSIFTQTPEIERLNISVEEPLPKHKSEQHIQILGTIYITLRI
jgi:hypothetical protein